jgi:hypothetical protein
MSYDRKKGRSQFDSQSQVPLKARVKSSPIAIHHWKDDFEGYKIIFFMFQKDLIWGKYEHPKFRNNKSPNFETFTSKSQKNMPFGCSPHKES